MTLLSDIATGLKYIYTCKFHSPHSPQNSGAGHEGGPGDAVCWSGPENKGEPAVQWWLSYSPHNLEHHSNTETYTHKYSSLHV